MEGCTPDNPVTCAACRFGQPSRARSGKPLALCVFEDEDIPVYHPPTHTCPHGEPRKEPA